MKPLQVYLKTVEANSKCAGQQVRTCLLERVSNMSVFHGQ